jgi:4-hydroxythreonine-4-phosphate dehydrogenase
LRPAPPAPLAVSLGDPAGVGPEIVVKTWRALRKTGPAFFVIGDVDALASLGGALPGEARPIADPAEARVLFSEALPVLHHPLDCCVGAGRPSPDHAGPVVDWIETGVRLCLEGQAAGLVTAPIAKAPLYAAGFGFPGHTEFLADLTCEAPLEGPRGPVMMLAAKDLRAVLVTIHEPLADVPTHLSRRRIAEVGRITAHALKHDFGIESPRLALAGLNPHAGEGGAIGREEIEMINPAAADLRAEGIACTDAKPADTLFHDEARAAYDAVICLYHDQALIPVKTLDFWGGVNITLGLPIVRTSPDHGTGFDIAGQGIARPDSLIAAVRQARQIADHRAQGVVAKVSISQDVRA